MIEYFISAPSPSPMLKWDGSNFAEFQSFITTGTVTDNGDGTLTANWFQPNVVNIGDYVTPYCAVSSTAMMAASYQKLDTPGDRYVLETPAM